jgi:glycogen debranching enzyme
MTTQLPSIVRFGRGICGDLAQCERREWWLSNGLGGYAAGTIASTLTRRYHGLLIAPVNPPLGRDLVFAKAVTGDAAFAQTLLEPIRDHLLDAGLGTVSEIFDGVPPHTPPWRSCSGLVGRVRARSV